MLILPLLLQPLVENAISHGITHLIEGGTVSVSARKAGAGLRLCVENNCAPERPRERSTGTGLDNVKRRVEATYGVRGNVTTSEQNGLYRVEISIPAEENIR
jgi:LytS/YehU family sensor histidine kinase